MKGVRAACLAIGVVCSGLPASASDVFYSDRQAVSANGRFRVEARSPDNRDGDGRKPFASDFTYTLTDLRSGEVLWSRKQGEDEGSCGTLFVHDEGGVVILTGWHELIFVGRQGDDLGRVDILKEAFTKEERNEFVSETTVGPMWAGCSLWYFVEMGDRRLFIIRPWWGRRVVTDAGMGRLIDEDAGIAAACLAREKSLVLDALRKEVGNRHEWEDKGCCEEAGSLRRASYLAGCLPVPEAVPLLKKLQDIAFIGSSTSGGLGIGEKFEGEVNPHNYETFTIRQAIQLSLRRLGRTPKPFPATRFDVQYEDHEKNEPYVPGPLAGPRADFAGRIEPGMKAEQVLNLVGEPDFVGYDTWEYDMDADPSFTLILKWDSRKVKAVDRKIPALWQKGHARDFGIVR